MMNDDGLLISMTLKDVIYDVSWRQLCRFIMEWQCSQWRVSSRNSRLKILVSKFSSRNSRLRGSILEKFSNLDEGPRWERDKALISRYFRLVPSRVFCSDISCDILFVTSHNVTKKYRSQISQKTSLILTPNRLGFLRYLAAIFPREGSEVNNPTMAPPSNNHAITHNSAHRWAMAFKPVLISSLHPRASTDVSASSVPLSFQCPQPSSVTILDFHLSWPHQSAVIGGCTPEMSIFIWWCMDKKSVPVWTNRCHYNVCKFFSLKLTPCSVYSGRKYRWKFGQFTGTLLFFVAR
jgi:hypothetical protein